jgi:hypothetical protein
MLTVDCRITDWGHQMRSEWNSEVLPDYRARTGAAKPII